MLYSLKNQETPFTTLTNLKKGFMINEIAPKIPVHIAAEEALTRYKSGKILTNRELVKAFGLFIESSLIDRLPKAYKVIANELIHDGFLTEEGEVL